MIMAPAGYKLIMVPQHGYKLIMVPLDYIMLIPFNDLSL